MTDQHPITPPDELKKQWMGLALSWQETLNIAAQWGADQELEACEIYLAQSPYPSWAKDLRAALRALAVRIKGADAIRQDILAIATELEGQP